jgi:small subunit ribosomal protein S14
MRQAQLELRRSGLPRSRRRSSSGPSRKRGGGRRRAVHERRRAGGSAAEDTIRARRLESKRIRSNGKDSQIVRQQRGSKYKTRNYNRCRRCGAARAYYRKFGLCRICLREIAHEGMIPGMTKSSW